MARRWISKDDIRFLGDDEIAVYVRLLVRANTIGWVHKDDVHFNEQQREALHKLEERGLVTENEFWYILPKFPETQRLRGPKIERARQRLLGQMELAQRDAYRDCLTFVGLHFTIVDEKELLNYLKQFKPEQVLMALNRYLKLRKKLNTYKYFPHVLSSKDIIQKNIIAKFLDERYLRNLTKVEEPENEIKFERWGEP